MRLTRLAMLWEVAARALWPLAALLAAGFAALAFGVAGAVPGAVLGWGAGLYALAVLAAAIRGGARLRRVDAAAARARVDSRLPGRPLSALADRAALGDDGLWQAHRAQMAQAARAARAVAPQADLARRDPYGLRLMAALACAMALIFGGVGQVGDGMAAIAASWAPADARPDGPAAPEWEGWAQPPAYTGRPTIYLNALEKNALTLPKGSVVSLRLYGDVATSQSIGAAQVADAAALSVTAVQSGALSVAGRRFAITVTPDAPPSVAPGAAPDRRADGRMRMDFTAADDFGVAQGQAAVTLDLPAVTREFGLAVAPEPRPDLVLGLPIPSRGPRSQISAVLAQDLSRHAWANLPVQVTLRVQDDIGQQGEAAPVAITLPGRRFFHPLAAALAEMRRDLLWSRDNARRSAEILRAVSWSPEGFMAPTDYMQIRGAVTLLEAGPLAEATRDDVAEALWQMALRIEDGGLGDALARMQAAQEKLSQAIRNGASADEIQRLMDDLARATVDYLDMLAEQDERDPAERFTRKQQSQPVTGDQIQQMMDEIQRLMNEGRMAEAQALLDQFNQMMQNMRVTQGQGGEGRGTSRPMNRLADTLRDQQELSDDAFREMQRQFGTPPGAGEDGGAGAQDGQALADRQRALREELGRQRGLMPGDGARSGAQARRSLDDAGRAMEGAERALRDGDLGAAMDRQAQAIQSMREGLRALAEAERAQGGTPSGQPGPDGPPGQADGAGRAMPSAPGRDPLGRATGGQGGSIVTGEGLAEGADPARRARDLLDEIRRRSGEMARPQGERDYLGRLLDRF